MLCSLLDHLLRDQGSKEEPAARVSLELADLKNRTLVEVCENLLLLFSSFSHFLMLQYTRYEGML